MGMGVTFRVRDRGQAEKPLTDDVQLDVGRPTGDGHALHVEEHVGRRSSVLVVEQRRSTGPVHRGLPDLLEVLDAEELGDGGLGTRLCAGQGP